MDKYLFVKKNELIGKIIQGQYEEREGKKYQRIKKNEKSIGNKKRV